MSSIFAIVLTLQLGELKLQSVYEVKKPQKPGNDNCKQGAYSVIRFKWKN